MKEFLPGKSLTFETYQQLCWVKVHEPSRVFQEAWKRKKPPLPGTRGKLLIVAADHNARMITSYEDSEITLGNRYQYLARLCRLLEGTAVDGIEGTPDILEDLILVDYLQRQKGRESFLNNKILIGTVNRGGLLGTTWEMDDRPLSFSEEGIEKLRLDGIKFMLRINPEDSNSGKTLSYCAEAVNLALKRKIPIFIESLYVTRGKNGIKIETKTPELVKAIGVALGLGTSSSHKWLEVPFSEDFQQVLLAASGPVLVVQEEKEKSSERIVREYCKGISGGENVMGTLLGRNILFAREDPLELAREIARLWKVG